VKKLEIKNLDFVLLKDAVIRWWTDTSRFTRNSP